MKNTFKKIICFMGIAGFVFAGSFSFVLAGDVSIKNNVSVSADTGGNTGGNVSEGKASVDIRVDSEIDGKKQEPVIIHEETTGGKIEKEVEVESEDGQIKTKVKTSVSAEGSVVSSDDSAKADDSKDDDIGVSTKSTMLALIGNFFASIGNSIWLSIKSIF